MNSAQNKRVNRLASVSTLEWVCLCVGWCLIYRYRWVLDDSTVYFRYVDNLLFLKRGLVYNQGEFVEGFSSPLWVFTLVAFRSLRLDYWTITMAVGTITWVAFWWATVKVNRLLSAQNSHVINLPLIVVATAYGPLSYFTSGSESPLMQLGAACVALYAVRPQSRFLQIVLGALPLIRNEFVIPLLALIIYRYLVTRRVPMIILCSALTLGGSWIAFRIYYYADVFPCPFYLKDKVSFRQGLYYVAVNGFAPYVTWFLLLAAAIAVTIANRIGRARIQLGPNALMAFVAVAALPYVMRVGGDMMHYRLISFSFCLLTLSLAGLLERVTATFATLRGDAARLLFGCGVGFGSFLAYPAFLSAHPVTGHEERLLDHGISDAPWHRHQPALEFNSRRKIEDSTRLRQYATVPAAHSGVETEIFCATIFARPESRFVHGYGLTDPILARVKAVEERPGHKPALFHLAIQLAHLRRSYPATQAGLVVQATKDGRSPLWMAKNLTAISLVEKRMYNRHRFWENLTLAIARSERIEWSLGSGQASYMLASSLFSQTFNGTHELLPSP